MVRAHVTLLSLSAGAVGVLSYACSLLLAHLLPAADYTVFAAAAGMVGTAGVAATALIPLPLAAGVRRHPAGSPQRRDAVTFAVAMSALVGLAAGLGLGGLVATFADPGTVLAVVVAALALFGVAPVWGVLQGEARFGRYAALALAEVTVRLVFSTAVVLLGAGVAGAMWGFVAGAAVVLVVAGAATARQLARDPGRWTAVLAQRARWSDVVGVAVVQAVLSAMAVADTVVVAAVLAADGADPVAAAGYAAVTTAAKAPIYLAVASSLVSFPQLRAGSGSPRPLIAGALRSFVRLLVPAVAVTATVPGGVALLALPAGYAGSLPLLPWLAVAGAGVASSTVLALLLAGVHDRRALPAGLAVAGVALLGGLLVGAGYGPAGVARGAAVGAVAGAAALLLLGRAWFLPARTGRDGAGRDGAGRDGVGRDGVGRIAVGTGIGIGIAAVVAVLGLLTDAPLAWSAVVVLLGVALLGGPALTSRARAAVTAGGELTGHPPPGRLHVLHLGFEDVAMPGSGGGSHRTAEINRRLAAAGHRVTVLTTRFPGAVDRTERHGGGSVRWVHIGLGAGRSRLTRLAGYVLAAPLFVRSVPADVVVEDFCAPFSSMSVPRWSSRPTVGVVQWLNARDKSRQYHLPLHRVEAAGVRSHHRLVAVSEGVAQRLRALNPGVAVSVIGNGVDAEARSVRPPRGDDVVFVGRLEIAQKGLDLLLDAWTRAAPQVRGTLVLAGDGPDEPQLRARVDRLGLADRVHFAGRVSGRAKFALLGAARLAAMPSRFETFGIVAAEARVVGTPLVAFDIDCLREIVPADCGVLVPLTGGHDRDAAAYAQALVAWHRDPPRLPAARRLDPAFEWDALARAQERVYRTAAGVLDPLAPALQTHPGSPPLPRTSLPHIEDRQ